MLPGRAWCTGSTQWCAQETARGSGLEEEARGAHPQLGADVSGKGAQGRG